jgi:UPF0755 protein
MPVDAAPEGGSCLQAIMGRMRVFGLVLPLLLLAVAVLYGCYAWVLRQLEPPQPGAADSVRVEIMSGANVRDVADMLHAAGLIREPTVFRLYTRYLHLDGKIRPGEYDLSPGMKPELILAKLIRGDVVHYRFTVPEGLTVIQVADHLAALGLVSRDRFIRVANGSAGLVAEFLPDGVHLPYPLEGYLFPDTYDYKKGVTEEEIIEQMVRRFREKLKEEYLARARERELTVHQLVTLASIIEKEAAVAAERPLISGVYHNRLAIGMKLDADPTVRYALNKPPQETLLYKDLEVVSPYNTYRNAGLPPGPIAAPGEASIRAALWPAAHDYFYFVAKDDGSGEHYFSRTLAEHEAYTDLAAKNREARR